MRPVALFCGLLLAGYATLAAAQPATTLPPQIATKLPEWGLRADQVSVYVRRIDEDQPRLNVNPDTPRIPASVVKLLTTIVGLDMLGSSYRWQTDVYLDGPLRGGKLQGDLYIQGYGDPYLSSDAFAGLVRALRAKGLAAIEGDVVFDNSFLNPPEVSRGDFDGNAQSAYNALPAALSVHRQVTDFYLYADEINNRVGIYTDPPLSGVTIVNNARLVNAPCQNRHHQPVLHLVEATATAPAEVRLSGTFASQCAEERHSRLFLTPEQHSAAAFDALWRDLGGQIGGKLRLGVVPRSATHFYRRLSPPLGEVIRDINKASDNLMARMVFLTLGVRHAGAPGSLEKSRQALAAWLTQHGKSTDGVFVDNGSGLSRDTRIRTGDFGELLHWAYQQPWMPELLSSMAIAGIDGTVRRRLRHEAVAGRAHLKTGTVRDASCIAGYVLDRNDRRWVVAVMVNSSQPGQHLGAWRGHAVQHEVLRWVYRGAP